MLTIRTDLFDGITHDRDGGGCAVLRRDLTTAQVAEAEAVIYAAYPPEGYGTALRQRNGARVIEWGGCE